MRLHQSLFFCTLLLIAGIGWCVLILQPFPLLHDYPEWMYQGWLVGQLLSGDAAVTAKYMLVAYPVPNSLSQVAIGLLSLVMAPIAAAKIWLVMYFAGAVALWVFLRRRYGDSLQILLLTVVVMFGPGFWNGYINFQCGLLLFAAYLYAADGIEQQGALRTLFYSLLIFFAHAAVFAIFIVYCVTVQMCRREASVPQRVQVLGWLVPSLMLLCWYSIVLLATFQSGSRDSMGLLKWAQYKYYTLAKQGPFHNFILHTGESLLEKADWLYRAGFAANFLFALLLIIWFVWLLWLGLFKRENPLRRESRAPVWVPVACIAVCMLVFFAAGANTFGVVNLGERFLIVALLIALILFKCQPVLQSVMTVLVAIFMVYVLAANIYVSSQTLQEYAVARSSATSDLTDYVDDIYAASRHQYFNHRLFIYADRGLELKKTSPALLDIDLTTSVVRPVQ